jgi:ParB family chromosome partitioning protein
MTMALALAPEIEVVPGQSIEELELNVITPAPDNPRRDLGDVTELAASMSELGLLQPLVVTPRAGKFMVVCGHRRYAAAKKAKLATVPAIIRSLTEPQRIKAMVIENCQRENLSPLEEARAYAQLVELGETQRAISDSVGKSQGHISKRLAILKLPPNVLKEVDSGGITVGDALLLADLADTPSAIDAVMKSHKQWNWPIDRAVREEHKKLEQHRKREAEIDRLKDTGIPYRPLNPRAMYEMPKGTMRVDPDRSWDSLPMKIGAHAKLPCHAATVDRYGTRIYLCIDPKSHAGEVKQAKERASRDAGRERVKKHERELKADQAIRRAFVAELLTTRIPKDEAVNLAVGGYLLRAEAEARKIACQLLDLKKDEKDGWYGVLEAYAAKGPAEQLRVGVAVAFASREMWLNSTYRTWSPGDKEYFATLGQHGYTPGPAENRELAGKKPS